MRKAFSEAVGQLALSDPRVVLISGDLGYGAFEEVIPLLGPRFINAGVIEQSMVGLAAGMAYRGLRPICYSIAPFLVFRPLEQIRVDVCIHRLPVCLVGNGGGYGYGIMGATHHALEDLACLSCLPHMTCYIPAHDDDVAPALRHILASGGPSYLRLGVGPKRGYTREDFPSVQSVRQADNPRLTVVALGPLVHNAAEASSQVIDVLAVTKIPFDDSLSLIFDSLRKSGRLVILEEHVSRGGLAELLCRLLLQSGTPLQQVVCRAAQGYPDGLYGSQAYHRQSSELDVPSLRELFAGMEC